jgi:hypothetical protein
VQIPDVEQAELLDKAAEGAVMTFAESLRAYADWCDEHPALQPEAEISTYGGTAAQAKGIMLADSGAKLNLLPAHEIVYLTQTFGEITVKHVIKKSEVCNLTIVDNMVVAVLKPEFEWLRP